MWSCCCWLHSRRRRRTPARLCSKRTPRHPVGTHAKEHLQSSRVAQTAGGFQPALPGVPFGDQRSARRKGPTRQLLTASGTSPFNYAGPTVLEALEYVRDSQVTIDPVGRSPHPDFPQTPQQKRTGDNQLQDPKRTLRGLTSRPQGQHRCLRRAYDQDGPRAFVSLDLPAQTVLFFVPITANQRTHFELRFHRKLPPSEW